MTPALSPIDLAVLIAYVGGVFALGCWFVRKSGNTEEFMAAGRSLPGWVVGLSIFGTYVSSISFLANPGKSYEGNWNPFVFGLSLPIAAIIAVAFFVPFYRKSGEISAYTHLENRFGPWARTYAAVCYLLTQIGRVGTILYLVALPFSAMFDLEVATIIVAIGVLVTIYTLLGGIEAVIWTDVVQSIVLTAGVLISAVVLLFNMPEGPSQLFEIAAAKDKFSLGDFGPWINEPTFWVVLVYGLFINLQNFGIDQSFVQRYATAKSDNDARRSVWLGALPYIPISAVLFFVGTALFAFYTAAPETLPTNEEGQVIADQVFPHFIITQLPPGLTGLLIAAILAAAMSSVDSSLNCSATLILQDVYKRYFRPAAGERESMRVLYSATVVFGVLGTGTAIIMIGQKSILDVWWTIAGLFSGGMLGLFLLGMLTKAGNRAAVIGVICGVAVIIYTGWSTTDFWPQAWAAYRSPLHKFFPIIGGTLTILAVGSIASRFTRNGGDARIEEGGL